MAKLGTEFVFDKTDTLGPNVGLRKIYNKSL